MSKDELTPKLVTSQLAHDQLNAALDADPALLQNMLEMGYLKPGPFRNHNGVYTCQYYLTEYGKRELQERDAARAMFEWDEDIRKGGQDR